MVTSYVRYDKHNGRPSETERQSVSIEGLINLRMLKIQSGPFGNIWEQPIAHHERHGWSCVRELSAMYQSSHNLFFQYISFEVLTDFSN
jgi:hypothetical protein